MKISGIDGKEYTIEPEASLRDANLEWANLEWANLSGAVWNDDTVFPEGFEIPEMSRDLDCQDEDFGL